jgi:UDP-N-acetylglucosamine transferase subunit ALG13
LIFICLGTQIYQFNRLLIEIDRLIGNGHIEDVTFAQIGHSDYIPRNFKYKQFLSAEEYENVVSKSEIVITHGGTGAIVKALKAKKQVIATPRLAKFNEHVDDHQYQIVNFFSNNGYILKVEDMNGLLQAIIKLKEQPIKKNFEAKGNIIEIIDSFIQQRIPN